MEVFVYILYRHTFTKDSRLPYFFLRQFLKNASYTKQTDNCQKPQINGKNMAGTLLRFDFKLLLMIWSVAVSINAVLKLADAPKCICILSYSPYPTTNSETTNLNLFEFLTKFDMSGLFILLKTNLIGY